MFSFNLPIKRSNKLWNILYHDTELLELLNVLCDSNFLSNIYQLTKECIDLNIVGILRGGNESI
jgi:hypothetical protein